MPVRRLFVSFPVPEVVQDACAQVQARLLEHVPARALSLVDPANLHVTLRFLGEVDVSLISQISARLQADLVGFGEFVVECRGVGWLPSPQRPRVFFAPVLAPPGKLEALHARVWNATAEVGSPEPDRPFLGHVTLARVRREERLPRDAAMGVASQWREVVFGSWTVKSCQLMASELHSDGARHSLLASCSLELPRFQSVI